MTFHIHHEHATRLFPRHSHGGPATPKTARTQSTDTVLEVPLVRSGLGWRPEGTRIEITPDDGSCNWFVDLGAGEWFFARSRQRAVEALIARGLIPMRSAS